MSDSVRKYKITDYAGSTRAEIIYNSKLGITTGISTLDYKPYGDTLDASTNFLPVQTFAGEERDVESSYMDMGYRTYDPLIGRFLQVDPLNESFPNITPYCYSYNSPMTWSDASGLAPWRIERSSGEVSYTVFNSQLMIHDMDGVHRITGDSFEEWWACLFSDMGGPNGGGFGGGGDFSLDRMGEEAENNLAERQERKEREKAERLAEKALLDYNIEIAKKESEARTKQMLARLENECFNMAANKMREMDYMLESSYASDGVGDFASNGGMWGGDDSKPNQIPYPEDYVYNRYGSITNAPTIINYSNSPIFVRWEDAKDQCKCSGVEKIDGTYLYEAIDGLATKRSNSYVFKLYTGGKIFIDQNGDIGVTYKSRSVNALDRLLYYSANSIQSLTKNDYLIRPHGWIDIKKANIGDSWIDLYNMNLNFRR